LKITALIAAAGKSTRMGTPKALLSIEDTTFVRHMVQRFLEARVEQIIITLPECDAAAQQIREEVRYLPRINFCQNSFPDRELLGSVQSSLRWHDNAILVMPIDVPCPTLEFLQTFLEQDTTRPSIHCTTHAGEFGHPILFTHHFFDEILQLGTGDTLRTVLNRHHDQIVTVESNDSNVIRNINTPSDYALFTNPSAKYFEAAATEAPGVKLR